MQKRVAAILAALLSMAVLPACNSSPPLPAACSQLPESGRCRASITRWWFDGKAGTCRAFIWGGCDGSVPFETREACHAQCMPGQPMPEDALEKTVRPVIAPAAQSPATGATP